MSADNWTVCPRCEDQRQQQIATKRAEADAAYGSVTVTEFDELRSAAETLAAVTPKQTFREDYSFSGTTSGTVEYGYVGSCSVCSLRCSFEGSELFYQPVTSLGES
jgi:hypothetical protein